LWFFIVLFIISPFFVSICPFPIFVQVYRPLPPGGNPIALNIYHIIIRVQKIQVTNFAGYT